MRASHGHFHRVFFALCFDARFCHQLSTWRQHLAVREGRWVAMANMHLTLSFLGEVTDRTLEQLLAYPFARLDPFELTFGELGYFSKPQVLFVQPHTTPAALTALHGACERAKNALRAGKKSPSFTPHVTLARAAIAPIPAATQTLSLASHHREFCLMQSHHGREGVYYRTLQTWPLQRALRPSPI